MRVAHPTPYAFATVLAVVIALSQGHSVSHAQERAWPAKPIRLIVPGGAGGVVDIRARWLAERLAQRLDQRVYVDNLPGAGGNLGTAQAAHAAPDGYTLAMVHQGTMTINPHLYGRPGYDPLKDFAPIARIGVGPLLLAVNSALPVTSVAQLVALAKEKPGQLTFGSPGIGTPPHMAGELFKQAAGIDLVNVPYRGSAPLLVALLAGEVDAAFEYPPTIKPHINAGTFRVLGIASPARSRLFPDVPTLAEQGYPVTAGGTIILAAPAGLPPAIADRLNAEVNKVLAQPDVRQRIMDIGYEPVGGTREEAASWIRSELAKWKRLARDIAYELD